MFITRSQVRKSIYVLWHFQCRISDFNFYQPHNWWHCRVNSTQTYYSARLKSVHQVWWILLLLLLITSTQLACSIHATWCIDLSRSLYIRDQIYLTCLNKPSKIQSLWHCDLPCAIKVGWDQVKPRFRCSRCCGLPPRSKALSMWEKKGEVSPRREKGRFIFQLSPQHGQPDMTSYSDWGGSLSWTGDEKLKKTHAFWKLLLLSF